MRISIIIFLLGLSMNAQDLKTNEDKFISVIFSSNIIQGVVGNEDFTFDFDSNGTEKIGLLKATKKNAKSTNLIVKTKNGILYNINLDYGIAAKNLVVIPESEGINVASDQATLTTAVNSTSDNTSKNTKNSIRENDYTIGNTVINDAENKPKECSYCDKILKAPKRVKKINSSAFGIKIQLENLYYFESKMFLLVNIINGSDIDYNLNYIKTYVQLQNSDAKSTSQYLEKNPIELYNTNKIIKGQSERKMIFIYDQFSIDKNKSLVFELNESNGERNLLLSIPNYIINNPVSIKKL